MHAFIKSTYFYQKVNIWFIKREIGKIINEIKRSEVNMAIIYYDGNCVYCYNYAIWLIQKVYHTNMNLQL